MWVTDEKRDLEKSINVGTMHHHACQQSRTRISFHERSTLCMKKEPWRTGLGTSIMKLTDPNLLCA